MSKKSVLSKEENKTQSGSYFVSNYPPYSFWTTDQVDALHATLKNRPAHQVPLGIYIHIPFCRRRCKFCYFKVYTDKKSGEIQSYLESVQEELRIYARSPFVAKRKPAFIYFGGGTPSYLSTQQITTLTDHMKESLSWDEAQEVALECEPGTLTEKKLRIIRDIGITRLSIGIEHFDDEILQANGRAHLSKEIFRAYDSALSLNFPQINIDLIAGMVGETPDGWNTCVEKAISMEPDSITIYQMELPHNTPISRDMRIRGERISPVADWKTKREWVCHAFHEFEKVGYTVTSGYTAVKDLSRGNFAYRDQLWKGADMIGLGVASFGHIGGIHYQNEPNFSSYISSLQQSTLPAYRALKLTAEETLIREMILQLKLGTVSRDYFQEKFGVDILSRFNKPLSNLKNEGLMEGTGDTMTLTREGLLRVDGLLPGFFLPQHQTLP